MIEYVNVEEASAQKSHCKTRREFWVAICALTQDDCSDDSLLQGDLDPPAMTLLPSNEL